MMTSLVCMLCGRALEERDRGRRRLFCSSACRQRAYRDRRARRVAAAGPKRDSADLGSLAQEADGQVEEKPVPHLSESQLLAWRGMLEIHARLLPVLDDDLRAVAGLSLSEFDALYQLWVRPGGRLRMKRLAEALLVTPSGATRLVTRLERDGLVRRIARPGEQLVETELTGLGRERLAVASDVHFAGVRSLFCQALTQEETAALVSIWAKLGGSATASVSHRTDRDYRA